MKTKINTTGDWKVQPKAENFLKNILNSYIEKCPLGEQFISYMEDQIAVRIRDIVDHITFNDLELIPKLIKNGWFEEDDDKKIFRNPSGFFPSFVYDIGTPKLCFKVEFVEDFLIANNLQTTIEGQEGSQYRQALAFKGNGIDFWVAERHGTKAFTPIEIPYEVIRLGRIHQQIFRSRRREYSQIDQGFQELNQIVDQAVADIGADWACDLFLRAEREYWMTRNKAGRIQKSRQDALGIGWANQDHHTFDSSRQHFYRTIQVLEKLGFECRELFYAGDGAGWGSQILEQPVLNSVIFADIDLAPEELDIDFAHDKNIKPLHPLRRAGLWCAMHGESMFEAGLNHLECMYNSKKLNRKFKELNIKMMKPFSDFPHLYQALTIGEWWAVLPHRIDKLESEGHISSDAAENFRQFGAIGSHFENLERNDGFKGFNQPGIDDVLRVIDPRKQLI